MKVLIVIALFFLGLFGLGMSLCGGLGMLMLHDSLAGVAVAAVVAMVGIVCIILTFKGASALSAGSGQATDAEPLPAQPPAASAAPPQAVSTDPPKEQE